MKAVILAGGLGTRISEETISKPKPMVEIGGKPILWHIMKIYSFHGINDFIICCGYKGYLIKEYFANYFLHQSDITFDITKNKTIIHQERAEPWKVTLVDTGEKTMTAGRIKRIKNYLKDDEDFCLTYGDGLANINIIELIKYHKGHGKLATLSAIYPPGRFGALELKEDQVTSFYEKPRGDGALVNGGFFVLNKKAIDYINGDFTIWEQDPLNNLANNGELMAFKHNDFWQSMDTIRDKFYLEDLWKSNKAPWKLWI
ncbi:MAG: glucose-1-phosphate cytidylyltransferase [Flavobacteriaceae bacterium]|nr:glucose-1-phosphate cytidylyltransferase [Flavobacteriaceae bacterium]MBT6447112.1 glucose-1-phosphate cytidylyltransferase [Flavobacteriaceae bacterium]